MTDQESPCVFDTVNPCRLDCDAVESDLGEFGYIVVIGESACDTAYPQFKALLNFGRNVSSDNHIGNGKTATGSKHPKYLLAHAVLVTREIDDAIRNDDVHRIARKGNVLDVSSDELDIGEATLALVFLGEGKHFVCHVETIRFAGETDATSRKQHVNAAAGAKVEHGFTRLSIRQEPSGCHTQERLRLPWRGLPPPAQRCRR